MVYIKYLCISMPEYSKHHFEILLRIWYFHSSLWSEIIFKCCFLFLNDNELLIVRYHQLTIEKTSRNYSNCSKLIIWPLLLHWKASGGNDWHIKWRTIFSSKNSYMRFGMIVDTWLYNFESSDGIFIYYENNKKDLSSIMLHRIFHIY